MSKNVPAYIALGSNLNDPSQQLHNALDALAGMADSKLIRVSSFYRSAAIGPGQQPNYLNAVTLMHTALEPHALLSAVQAIENQQGRTRSERWGPRTLDLDILLYGDQVINSPTLTVPHPRMHERDFVLYPLHEISDTETPLPESLDLNTLIARLPTISRLPTAAIVKTTETHRVDAENSFTQSQTDSCSNSSSDSGDLH